MKSTLTSIKKNVIVLFGMLAFLASSCEKQEQVTQNALDGDPVILEKTASASPIKAIPEHYVVDVKPGQFASAKLAITLSHGNILTEMEEVNLIEVQSPNTNFEADVEAYSSVVDCTPSLMFESMTGEMSVLNTSTIASGISGANPYYAAGLQWSHTAINSEGAWSMNQTGDGAVVAVLDGGFFPNHPDIAANVLSAVSFHPTEGPVKAVDGFSHGTHVAGIIAAADNDAGCLGVAPDAKLRLIKVLGDNGSGAFTWVWAGMLHAADLDDVDIMNMSLGGLIDLSSVPPQLMWDLNKFLAYNDRVVQICNQKGKLVVISAGNSAINPQKDNYMVLPVMAAQAFGVSALGPNNYYDDWVNGTSNANLDMQAYYTNTGIQIVDVAASGGNIDFALLAAYYGSGGSDTRVFRDLVISPSGEDDYYWAQGTSMSAPQAAGVAALIVGKYGSMSPKALKTKLYQGADDLGKKGRDDVYGLGRVNAYNSVK